MTERHIPYAKLDHVLRELGFVEKSLPHGIGYHHPATDLILLLPTHTAKDFVGPRHLAIVRKYLDEYGLVPSSDFDRRLGEPSVAV